MLATIRVRHAVGPVAAAIVVMLNSTLTPQAAIRGDGITAAPCPVQDWQHDDPTFQALPGAKATFGRYDGGLYRIEIPDTWNGELVLWAHGFADNQGARGSTLALGNPGAGNVGAGPTFRQHLSDRGFAWAASSYRCNGYVPGIGLLDTLALADLFSKTAGRSPARTYLAGGSMGGHTTLLGMQEFPRRFDGGLALCPAGAPTLDFLEAVAQRASTLTGVPLDGAMRAPDVLRFIEMLGTPPALTDKGRELARAQLDMSGGPRPFAGEGLTSRFLVNIHDGVRVRAERTAGPDRYEERMPFDGLFERPLMTVHGTGDLYVPISLQRDLKRAVDAAGRSQWLVQRTIRVPGHCGFSRAEQRRAFDDLVNWVRDGVRPEGDDVMGDLSNAGLKFTDPLRPGDPGMRTP